MKIARFTIAIALAAGLSACAATQEREDTAHDANLQAQYMTAVNNTARGYATRVHWVNPPSGKTIAARYGKDKDDKD